MKKLSLLLILLSSTIIQSNLFSQKFLNQYAIETKKSEINFFEVQKWAKEKYKGLETQIAAEQKTGEYVYSAADKRYKDYIKYKRWEWYWSSRINIKGELMSPSPKEYATHNKMKNKNKAGSTWKSSSSTSNSGGYWGMGRAECIGFHPTNGNTFYVGSIGGGIWKTTNNGNSYTSIGDDLPSTQVGNIVVDHQNPNTLYITIGGVHGWWNLSMGVYKSTNGGATWNTTGLSSDFSTGEESNDLIMSPTNNNTLLVSTGDGIYRTTNSGVNWTKVINGQFTHLKWKPNDANVVYAVKNDYWGSSEVFKSTNAGASFTQITNINTGQNNLKLAVSEANSNHVAYIDGQNRLYYSTNNGNSFSYRSTVPGSNWFYLSPNNTNNIYIGQIDVHKSTNGGYNFNQISLWYGGGQYPEVHADTRRIYHNPINKHIYFCNDGGIAYYNESNNNWTEIDDGLVITQYYRISCAQTDSTIVQGGTQDNGSNRRRTNGTWYNTNGGDGMETNIDPTNANIMYCTYVNGRMYRTTDGWVNDTYTDISANIPGGKPNGSWVTPYELDPNNSSTIIAGYNDVYKSTNRGNSWTRISTNIAGGNTLATIAIAPSNSNTIYASTGNVIYKTTNGGGNWASYTLPGNGSVSRVAIHPTNANIAWASKSGFTPGDKVYKTTDGGANWTNVSGILPNVPVHVVVYDKNSNDGIYIGNEWGIYYRDATMNNWVSYSNGLPNTMVTDIDIQYSSRKIYAGTYGRGIWEASLFSIIKPPSANFSSNANTSCNGVISFTDLSEFTPTSWLWNFGDGNSSTIQNPTHTYTSPGNYNVNLTVTNSDGSDNSTISIPVIITSPPSTNGDSICNAGIVNLSAVGSGSGNLVWYDSPINGNIINTGTSYSPNLTNTTTFYVEEEYISTSLYGGPPNNNIGTGANYNYDQSLIFDVLQASILASVKVYAQGTANRTIELLDNNNNVLESKTVSIPNGEQRVQLDFPLPTGIDFTLTISGEKNLYRNNNGVSYPYSIGNLVSIKNSSAGVDYYYFFYDWEVKAESCKSLRTPVKGIINNNCVIDNCPNDPNKTEPGICGCGTPDIDSDNDGIFDCNDDCPNDPNKTAPGVCGCGTPDTDTDNDGTADCNDDCPNDPNKTKSGDCGCGTPDTDTDNDGTANCNDDCPNDPNKIAAGNCGCGVADTDTDNDGTADCNDDCPNDPNKIAAGNCGCGVADTDTDNDGMLDCNDGCMNDPNKTSPGNCGCGNVELTPCSVGISKLENELGINIYPNPTSGILNIEIPTNSTNYSLIIFDVIGKQLNEKELKYGLNQLNINSYNNGIYFIKVSNKENISSIYRVIKN